MAPGARQKRRGKGAAAPGVSSEGANAAPLADTAPDAGAPNPVLSLLDIDLLKDPDERRRAMLARIAYFQELAAGRHYLNKHGDMVAVPDMPSVMNFERDARELLGAEPAKPARKGADLSVFNGGKAAERNAG